MFDREFRDAHGDLVEVQAGLTPDGPSISVHDRYMKDYDFAVAALSDEVALEVAAALVAAVEWRREQQKAADNGGA